MNFYDVLPALAATVCCAVLCFCCIWCLKSKGARPLPWPWLPIVLAVAAIPAALWAFQNNYVTTRYGVMLLPFHPSNLSFVSPPLWKPISLSRFLSRAAECRPDYFGANCLGHVLSRLACLGLSILIPIAIFLYQYKQRRNSK